MAVLNTTYDIKWGKPDCTPMYVREDLRSTYE